MELTDEQAAIRDVVQDFATEEIRPTALEADRTASFPEDVWDGLADLELTALTVPEEYGGFDADPVTAAVVYEEVARGMLAVATALSVHGLATSCIATFGSDDLQERWLPDMAAGRPVGAFALSEPHAGSNPAALSTVARRDGDEYVIDGEKQWITNGQRAGVYVLFARTDPDDPGSITQFLVPGDVDGLSVGEPEDKLGLRASDTTSLTFDGVRIPTENRLTEEGKGLSAALSVLTGGRIAIAAQSVGLAQSALEDAIDYSQEREQFGGPIGDIQAVRHRLAEMATRTRAARLLTRDAARKRGDAETAAGGAALEASMAKYFASETAMFVTNEAVQLHGGAGYVTETDVERLYRDAKITEIYEGTTEIQKTVIARELLDGD
ncbi:acyl-CoA dehydrogenase family protein [Natrarchaeobaculum aegyptiacum]|uniref:Acyl-CoA dehydrogenase n=1 Tax=Natrarchaeobaculum aegyptiacum TaxID=745377 RepID=A0A2Z2HSM6_9EURY|nr:acyl-CoA dehydrogenase family protein [Natrarchaeobaculum aegyptiacum]ARS89085.1 acyl-CoA dehydrogenase [Natrarchaeobaculum aegyptiacum]